VRRRPLWASTYDHCSGTVGPDNPSVWAAVCLVRHQARNIAPAASLGRPHSARWPSPCGDWPQASTDRRVVVRRSRQVGHGTPGKHARKTGHKLGLATRSRSSDLVTAEWWAPYVAGMWLCYIDECGNTGKRVDPDQPRHILATVLVPEDSVRPLSSTLE